MRAQERLLDDALGVAAGAAQRAGGGRVQAPAVALVQDVEGLLAPGAEERDEVLVGAESERGGRHRVSVERKRDVREGVTDLLLTSLGMDYLARALDAVAAWREAAGPRPRIRR